MLLIWANKGPLSEQSPDKAPPCLPLEKQDDLENVGRTSPAHAQDREELVWSQVQDTVSLQGILG